MAAMGNENACGVVPAAGRTPALSRSSSRKTEQSPYRRNPMAEIDDNTLRNNNNNNGEPQKKFSDSTVCEKAKPEIPADAPIAAKTNVTRTASLVAGCRSRRASRDFDQSSNSYASQILEDIQNYHEQHQAAPATPSFSLPACVAKACSILEAVADINSSSSPRRTTNAPSRSSADDKGSVNAAPSGADNARAAEQAEPQEPASAESRTGRGVPATRTSTRPAADTARPAR